MRKHVKGSLLALFTGLTIASTGQAESYTYTTINAPTGTTFKAISGIGLNGEVYGTDVNSSGVTQSFVYNNGQASNFAYPITGILNDGTIIGSYKDSNNNWTGYADKNGVLTGINDPLAAGGTVTSGVLSNGAVVGYYYDANKIQQGFSELNGVFTSLSDPNGAKGTVINGVLNDDTAYGFYVTSTGSDVNFTESKGVFTDSPSSSFSVPGALFTTVEGVLGNGEIYGNYVNLNYLLYGFTELNGVYTSIADPNVHYVPDQGTTVTAVRANGEVYGNYNNTYGGVANSGFSEINGQYTTISYPASGGPNSNIISTNVNGVNANGEVFGTYTATNNVTYGFVALSSVPLPSACWLFISVLISYAGFTRKLKH